MNHEYTLTTKHLLLVSLSNEEMKEIILQEEDDLLKECYMEMYDGCLRNPDKRIWYALWILVLKEDESIRVGTLSFKGLESDGVVEIGYGMVKEYEGRGYMTEAVTAMAAWARKQPGVTKVEAETEPDHIASQRVLEKAGFRPNGVLGLEGPRFEYMWKE